MRFCAYNASTERIAQLAGAVPTQVEVPDLPIAFFTGRVQAMITSPSIGANSKSWDYLDHYYDTQARLPKNMVIVNKAAFEALPADVQKSVKEAAATAETRGWEVSKKGTAEKTQMLKDHGIKVQAPSKELEDGFKAIARRWCPSGRNKPAATARPSSRPIPSTRTMRAGRSMARAAPLFGCGDAGEGTAVD
ncbi:hypothetical protein [Breoghania sp.]|uniref:hypothetical protein n=1 Tax=Breoghania sp. TaxID=2065378 RepID=UPI0026318E58|nr:hypothetical protein [Breoghania sp.]MDJ0931139.1 hypothetical protein [Breoghania sp.]